MFFFGCSAFSVTLQINLSPEIAAAMFVPDRARPLFVVVLEVVEVVELVAEMTVVQVQMLVVVVLMTIEKKTFRSGRWWCWCWLKWELWWWKKIVAIVIIVIVIIISELVKFRSYFQILGALCSILLKIYFFQHLIPKPKNQLQDFMHRKSKSL